MASQTMASTDTVAKNTGPTRETPNINGQARRLVRMSPWIGLPLAVLMVIMALQSLIGMSEVLTRPGLPLFVTIRHPETDMHFLKWRLANTPAWLYQGSHAAPALAWSILMPLQHADFVRKKWPAFHRASGYLLLGSSLVLSLSGYYLAIKRYAHSHPNRWHWHDLNGFSPIGWPTFEASLWALGPLYITTLIRTAQTARAKQYASHRQWAVAHTICASVIALERVSYVSIHVLGLILSIFPEEKTLEFLGIPNTVAGKAAAELDMFALANVFAAVLMFTWLFYEWSQAGYLPSIRRMKIPFMSRTREKTE